MSLKVIIIFLLIEFLFNSCKVIEAGFDDGPFYGSKVELNPKDFKIKESLPYRDGFLQIMTSSKFNQPVLGYSVTQEIKWAYKLETNEMPQTDLFDIYELSIHSGIFRDKITFIGEWTHGAERGTGYVWKYGELRYFYLSW